MKKVNRIISLIVLVCFIFNTAISDLAFGQTVMRQESGDKLSIASRFNDLAGVEAIHRIKIEALLQTQLKKIAGNSNSLDVTTLPSLLASFADTNDKSSKLEFSIPGTQLFSHELKSLPNGYFRVMCRITNLSINQKPRTYHAIFATEKDQDAGFPIYVYTDTEYQAFVKSGMLSKAIARDASGAYSVPLSQSKKIFPTDMNAAKKNTSLSRVSAAGQGRKSVSGEAEGEKDLQKSIRDARTLSNFANGKRTFVPNAVPPILTIPQKSPAQTQVEKDQRKSSSGAAEVYGVRKLTKEQILAMPSLQSLLANIRIDDPDVSIVPTEGMARDELKLHLNITNLTGYQKALISKVEEDTGIMVQPVYIGSPDATQAQGRKSSSGEDEKTQQGEVRNALSVNPAEPSIARHKAPLLSLTLSGLICTAIFTGWGILIKNTIDNIRGVDNQAPAQPEKAEKPEPQAVSLLIEPTAKSKSDRQSSTGADVARVVDTLQRGAKIKVYYNAAAFPDTLIFDVAATEDSAVKPAVSSNDRILWVHEDVPDELTLAEADILRVGGQIKNNSYASIDVRFLKDKIGYLDASKDQVHLSFVTLKSGKVYTSPGYESVGGEKGNIRLKIRPGKRPHYIREESIAKIEVLQAVGNVRNSTSGANIPAKPGVDAVSVAFAQTMGDIHIAKYTVNGTGKDKIENLLSNVCNRLAEVKSFSYLGGDEVEPGDIIEVVGTHHHEITFFICYAPEHYVELTKFLPAGVIASVRTPVHGSLGVYLGSSAFPRRLIIEDKSMLAKFVEEAQKITGVIRLVSGKHHSSSGAEAVLTTEIKSTVLYRDDIDVRAHVIPKAYVTDGFFSRPMQGDQLFSIDGFMLRFGDIVIPTNVSDDELKTAINDKVSERYGVHAEYDSSTRRLTLTNVKYGNRQAVIQLPLRTFPSNYTMDLKLQQARDAILEIFPVRPVAAHRTLRQSSSGATSKETQIAAAKGQALPGEDGWKSTWENVIGMLISHPELSNFTIIDYVNHAGTDTGTAHMTLSRLVTQGLLKIKTNGDSDWYYELTPAGDGELQLAITQSKVIRQSTSGVKDEIKENKSTALERSMTDSDGRMRKNPEPGRIGTLTDSGEKQAATEEIKSAVRKSSSGAKYTVPIEILTIIKSNLADMIGVGAYNIEMYTTKVPGHYIADIIRGEDVDTYRFSVDDEGNITINEVQKAGGDRQSSTGVEDHASLAQQIVSILWPSTAKMYQETGRLPSIQQDSITSLDKDGYSFAFKVNNGTEDIIAFVYTPQLERQARNIAERAGLQSHPLHIGTDGRLVMNGCKTELYKFTPEAWAVVLDAAKEEAEPSRNSTSGVEPEEPARPASPVAISATVMEDMKELIDRLLKDETVNVLGLDGEQRYKAIKARGVSLLPGILEVKHEIINEAVIQSVKDRFDSMLIERLTEESGQPAANPDDDRRSVSGAAQTGTLRESTITGPVTGEIFSMAMLAEAAGKEIPTDAAMRYNLLVTPEFFASGELARHRNAYGDRFNIGTFDTVNKKTRAALSYDEIVSEILLDASGKEGRTAVLISKDTPREQLDRLAKANIRFILVDTKELLSKQFDKYNGDAKYRQSFQVDTYAKMLLVRRIDGSIDRNSPLYNVLRFYIKTHFNLTDNLAVEDYIQAIVNNEVAKLIKGYLSYRPAQQYNVPEYKTIAAALMAA